MHWAIRIRQQLVSKKIPIVPFSYAGTRETPSLRRARHCHRDEPAGLVVAARVFALHCGYKVGLLESIRPLRRTLRYWDVPTTCRAKTTERRRTQHHRSPCLHAAGHPAGGPSPPLLLGAPALVPTKRRRRFIRPSPTQEFAVRQFALYPLERCNRESRRARWWNCVKGQTPADALCSFSQTDSEEAQSNALIDQAPKERRKRKSKADCGWKVGINFGAPAVALLAG